MGLDAWGVKLKNNDEWESASWEDIIEDFQESSIIPEGNCFHEKNTYTQIHNNFIHSVINAKGFTGDPCCSRDVMSKVSTQLKQWLRNNPNTNWEDKDGCVNYVDTLSANKIKDLVEYISILDENGCVMWFSS